MRLSTAKKALSLAYRARRPVMLWGPPGVGKSQVVAQVAQESKVDLIDWRLCLMQDVDLRGIPSVEKNMTVWNPPAELPRKGKGILFLDELMQSATATTNAASQLILDRRLGSYELPEGWVVFAASNRDKDRAATQRMATHIANRFLHFEVEVNVNDWCEYAQDPAHGFDPRVFAFIRYRPEMLHRFDAKSEEKAFASPRSWQFASQVLREFDGSWLQEECIELMSGVVGREAATEFVAFLRIMESLVDIDLVLSSPDSAPVPTDPSVCYALVYALVNAIGARAGRSKLFAAALRYIERMKSDEFCFLFMRQVERVLPELLKTAEYIRWASANHAKL